MDEYKLEQIPLSRVVPSRWQPRDAAFDAEKLWELARSIKEQGLINAVVVFPVQVAEDDPEPWYELVAGERRTRAAVGLAWAKADKKISEKEAVELIGESSDYDILLEGIARVEVKSALLSNGRGRRVRWQFCLRRRGCAVDEDLLFLLCYEDVAEDPVAFVIPGHALNSRLAKIDITSRDPREYRGKWPRFRGSWSEVRRVVDTLPTRQPALFRARDVEQEVPF